MSPSHKLRDPGVETIALSDLISRLARELRIAAAIADDCQDAIGDDEALVLAHATAVRLQGLDLLSQQLIEISRVLDRLASDELSGNAPTHLLDDVLLTDVRRRLAGLTDGICITDQEIW